MTWRVDRWIAEELGEQPSAAQLRQLLGLLDAKLAAQLEAIVHSPEFQRLEGNWRGLYFLVEQAASAEAPVAICVLNVSADDLRADLAAAPDVEDTTLWREVQAAFAEGRPFSVLVCASPVGPSGDDLLLLQFLAVVAATWQALVLADAAPTFAGLKDWSELSTIREALQQRMAGPTHAAWRSFREKEDAAYVALVLPPVRARPPHQPADFTWTEPRGRVPWTHAGLVVAAALVQRFLDEGVRFHEPAEEAVVPSPTGAECRLAVDISDRRARDFAELGLTPLWPRPGTLQARLGQMVTCHRPPRFHDAQAQAAADLLARFDILMSLTALARGLMLQARRLRLARASTASIVPQLQQWLDEYVASQASPERLLTAAQVQLGPTSAHRPMPPLQLECQLRALPPWPPLRFLLEIP
jgi:type VI secretion system protein ImpC